jgi:phosphatidylglycerol:prolipoprotein diacylglycerol transferase
MIAFMIGIYIATKEAKKVGIDPVKILDLSIVIFIFSLVGAKFFHVLFDGHLHDYINMCVEPFKVENMAKYYPGGCKTDAMCSAKDLGNICNLENGKCYEKSCTAAFELWRGGFVFYGGLIGGFLSATVFIIKKKMNFLKIIDIGAPVLALGLAIGRVGCYMAGCCFGNYTSSFLGISFPSGSPAYEKHLELYPDLMHNHIGSLTVFPTQLFSAGANFIIFLYLILHLKNKKKYNGQVFIQFLILYSVFRFIIEFFRGDDRGKFLFFTTSQWISVTIISLSILAIFKIKKMKTSILDDSKEKVENV